MTFAIVDDEEFADLVKTLERVCAASGIDHQVQYFQKPAELLTRLNLSTSFDVILLDHYWPDKNYSARSIVEQIDNVAPSSKVVIFTGRDLEAAELYCLTRLGIAAYLIKAEYSSADLAHRLVEIASNSDLTLEKLKLRSESAIKLEKKIKDLEAEVNALRVEKVNMSNQLDARAKGESQRLKERWADVWTGLLALVLTMGWFLILLYIYPSIDYKVVIVLAALAVIIILLFAPKVRRFTLQLSENRKLTIN